MKDIHNSFMLVGFIQKHETLKLLLHVHYHNLKRLLLMRETYHNVFMFKWYIQKHGTLQLLFHKQFHNIIHIVNAS